MTITRALVHLGPVKTGTTALSRYFTLTNKFGLTPKSIIYPAGDLWFPHQSAPPRRLEESTIEAGVARWT